MHRSVFLTHGGPLGPAQQRWRAVLAVGDHAVLGGSTAAAQWGLRGHEDRSVHLLLPAGHKPRRAPAGVVVHRSSVLDDGAVFALGRPPRTRMARSLVDAAQWARTDAEARAIVAAGFQQRLVREDDVRAVLHRLRRAHRRRLIGETVADAAGGAHSLAELDFLALCRSHHLPEPSRQVVRHDATGRRRYLDASFDEWRVHVEVDGAQHLEARQAWADMRRHNELWISGERVLRFPAWILRNAPAEVVAHLRAALTSAGWPG